MDLGQWRFRFECSILLNGKGNARPFSALLHDPVLIATSDLLSLIWFVTTASAPIPAVSGDQGGITVTANAKVIRSERYAEIGSIVQRDVAVLIDQWAKRAVEEQPNARRVHHSVLLNDMSSFLWEVGQHLASAGDAGSNSPSPFRHPARRTTLGNGVVAPRSHSRLSHHAPGRAGIPG